MSEYDEIFDVVDSEDMVIGKASKLQVHNNELMRRSVHILVFNSTGSLFLQKRAMIKDETLVYGILLQQGMLSQGKIILVVQNENLMKN